MAESDYPPMSAVTLDVSPKNSAPTREFFVESVSGASKGTRLHVPRGRSLVGTSQVCALRLDDASVSRRHLALVCDGATLKVEDLDSTNGTVVNGTRIEVAYLKGDETVEVGGTILVVRSVPAVAASVAPPRTHFGRVIGASATMQEIYALADRIAATEIPCVIEGETGTGKEHLAEAIHEAGPRAAQPFVVFDCTAVPGNLMESALFGHERGAFTGAAATRRGVFEQANGGTLFIDEIGDLDLSLQPKLLRAIQRGEVQRVGGEGWIKTNVRVLAATRRDLDREVQSGRFRDDLFFRLAVARIEVPPLRERRDDVDLLARHFWAQVGGPGAGPLPPDFLPKFEHYPWPGNVRELLNTIIARSALGDVANLQMAKKTASSQSVDVVERGAEETTQSDLVARLIRDEVPFSKARQLIVEDFDRRYVSHALEKYDGNVTRAAQALGIGRRYFHMLKAKAST